MRKTEARGKGQGAKVEMNIRNSKFEIRNFLRFTIHCSLFTGLLLLTSHFLLLTSSSAAPVDDTVASLQKQFAAIKDLKGKFIQKSYIKDLEENQEYSGSFFIKKPSRMMWEYGAPRDEKVVVNDLNTWIYKKSQNQVIKTTFTKESYSQVPITLLASLEHIRDDFDITMPEKNALQLAPKRKIGFIKTIVLELASGDMPVKMFTIFDTYGNIIMIELKNVQTNAGLGDAIFNFQIPPGAEVYDMSK